MTHFVRKRHQHKQLNLIRINNCDSYQFSFKPSAPLFPTPISGWQLPKVSRNEKKLHNQLIIEKEICTELE